MFEISSLASELKFKRVRPRSRRTICDPGYENNFSHKLASRETWIGNICIGLHSRSVQSSTLFAAFPIDHALIIEGKGTKCNESKETSQCGKRHWWEVKKKVNKRYTLLSFENHRGQATSAGSMQRETKSDDEVENMRCGEEK
ncbi:hypothetical protein AG1IA_07185 [Rhizoctonia solani AG-1 IA]|uniref:Uncharacterized protein n=1 Tax=Thanatephorus cucumeris (strain AG1-IA) TaxID=983506 RepID=L8WR34_THACA|nr:hypothetical protein AG1IA_07185 [Rhizoctonia solani AG-1 IA]